MTRPVAAPRRMRRARRATAGSIAIATNHARSTARGGCRRRGRTNVRKAATSEDTEHRGGRARHDARREHDVRARRGTHVVSVGRQGRQLGVEPSQPGLHGVDRDPQLLGDVRVAGAVREQHQQLQIAPRLSEAPRDATVAARRRRRRFGSAPRRPTRATSGSWTWYDAVRRATSSSGSGTSDQQGRHPLLGAQVGRAQQLLLRALARRRQRGPRQE